MNLGNDIMIELVLLLMAQAVSSYFSTLTIRAAVSAKLVRFVAIAAISDTIKLTIISSVSVLALQGHWLGVPFAVMGAAIGNTIEHLLRRINK